MSPLLPILFWLLTVMVAGTIVCGALYLVVRAAVRDGIRQANVPEPRPASSVKE